MKKQYSYNELSEKRCLKCLKHLKKNSGDKKLCYKCYQKSKQNKKHSNGETNGNNAKHFEIVKQNGKKSIMKYTIKLKTVKAVNVFKYAFKTIPNVKLNGNFSLNTSDYNIFLVNLQYWQ